MTRDSKKINHIKKKIQDYEKYFSPVRNSTAGVTKETYKNMAQKTLEMNDQLLTGQITKFLTGFDFLGGRGYFIE